LKVFLWITGFSLLLFGGSKVTSWVAHAFDIPGILVLKEIKVNFQSPHHVLSQEEILQSLELKPGMRILDADVSRLANQIAENERIRRVEVKRNLAGKIDILVTERIPTAYVKHGSHLNILVDREGVLFPLLEGSENPDLPVITGVNPTSAASTEKISKALELIEMIQDDLAAEISEVRLRANSEIDIWMRYGLQIRMGKGNYWSKVQRLTLLKKRKGVEFRHWKYIDLRWGDPVTSP